MYQPIAHRHPIAPAGGSLQRVVHHQARDPALRPGVIVAVLHPPIRGRDDDQRHLSGAKRLGRSRVAQKRDL